ncbi:tRNA lysidine(34) synthetase TilS [Dolosicoccus paucivorans]
MTKIQHQTAQSIYSLKTLVVAVSGGVDSMALLHAVKQVKHGSQQVIVAHFMHHLRKEGVTEKELVQKVSKEYGFIYEEGQWSDSPKTHIESSARKARYQFFKTIYDKYHADALLTGHHLNDDVETFLMRLIRGSSIKGLLGIQPLSQRYGMSILRPLLEVSKKSLYQYANKYQIAYLEDQSNYTPAYYRNRVRLEWLPLFTKENPRAIEHIHQHQEQLSRFYRIIVAQFEQWCRDNVKQTDTQWQIDLTQWSYWGADQQTVYLELLFEEQLRSHMGPYHHRLLDQLRDNLNQDHSFELDINKKWQLQYAYGYLTILQKKKTPRQNEIYSLKLNQWTELPTDEAIGLFELEAMDVKNDEVTWIPVVLSPDIVERLVVRTRRPGDVMRLKMGPRLIRKRFNKLQMELKISPFERTKAWLVSMKDQSEIIWYPHYCLGTLYNPSKTDKMTHIFAYKKQTEK